MCPPNLKDFQVYVPVITYVYGQVLDGFVGVLPQDSVGTITITANGVLFCTLASPSTGTACAANSTNFDVAGYTLYAYFDPANGDPPSQSLPVSVTVLQDVIANFKLKSSMNPAPVGSAVTFTATALGTYGEAATGAITFTDGGSPIGSGLLDMNGTASFVTSTLSVGTHIIHASYPGSVDLAAPQDAVLTQVIAAPVTITTLTSSVNPSSLGQSVTFTASVGTTAPGLHPSGAVNFNDGTKTFATVPVSPQGTAPASISTLSSGTHSITANYSGDAATGSSVSNVVVQQVDFPLAQAAPGFIVAVTPSPVVLGTGLTAPLTVTVTPRGGFSEPVTLTCGNLPHESTCTFAESVIPAGGGTTTLGLFVSSPHDCGSTTPYFYGANRPGPGILRYGSPALAGLLCLLLPGRRPRRRRWNKGLLALCAAVSLAGLSGCSSTCTDFGTYPGSYTFQVIGTAPATTSGASSGSGTPLVVQTSVALTVKI